MSTEMVLRSVAMNETMVFIGFIILVGALVAWFEYVIRRWSWVPRKRQRKSFTERW